MHLSAGLLDLQVNGFAGVDFNAGTFGPKDIDHALEALLATGVTHLLPTIITARPEDLAQRLKALDKAISASRLGRLMCPGYHLEGPFLNPQDGFAGCHPATAMGAASAEAIDRLEAPLDRPILLVTVAPETEGGLDLIAAGARRGRIMALGHTACDFDTARAAADAGALLSTHLGNGLPQVLHKLANPIFAQLAEDRLWASFIADGIHIHPQALKSLLRVKGLSRSILVTDAVTGAAAEPGRYDFAGMPIERGVDGAVRQLGGATLAGSALCLDQAVRNLVAWGLASPREALTMAADNPRRLLAPALARFGLSIGTGRVVWNDALEVVEATVSGSPEG